MSWEVVGLVSKRKCGGAVRRVLLLTLAQYAGHNGETIFASVPSLARDAEVDARTVQRNIKSLIEEGLLEYVGARKCRHGYTNEYRLMLPAIRALPEIVRTEDLAEANPRQKVTPVSKPPVTEVEFTPVTLPPPAERPPGTESPNPRQPATQSYQGTIAAASVERTPNEKRVIMDRILAACGPRLVDESKSATPRVKLAGRITAWLTKYDVDEDIIPVLVAKTQRGNTLYDPTIFEPDIAAHHAARMKPLPIVEFSNERAREGSANRGSGNGQGGYGARPGSQPRSGNLAAGLTLLEGLSEAPVGVSDGPEDWGNARVAGRG